MRSSLPGFERSDGGVLERGSEEKAKERGERVAEVLVVLMRARGESGGLYPVLSTAAARWRPLGGSVLVARRGERQREAKGRWRRSGETRRCQRKQEVAGKADQRGGRRCPAAARSKAGKQAGCWKKKGIYLQFPKIPGTQL